MNEEKHSNALQTAFDSLTLVGGSVRIVGGGIGRFLVANLGEYGIKFYTSEEDFVIDPAIGDELQGERAFASIAEAMRFASDWLKQKQ